MANNFSLEAIRNGVGKRTAELNEEAQPRSLEDDRPDRTRPFQFEHNDYDRTEAPKDEMRQYWRQFETTPIVRKPVTSFASRVTEPGYFLEARELEQDEIEKLGKWLKNAAIIEGLPGKDFRLLARKAIVQREIRGTALVEKAPHEDDMNRVAGLKLINPEVCEAVTRPQQNILIEPDDDDRFPEAPEAESGGKAAWLQDVVEAREVGWGMSDRIKTVNGDADDDLKIGFKRDEIVPLTRDADVGEVFGTSRLEAVSDRIEGIKQKLDDNDKAIESKAYPLWLFQFGDPETTGVWDSDMINEFMSAHEMENFNPGMKQGVRGDVSIDTVSGEVAEIAEYLNFDIQWIMASMPMPMFTLGAFSGNGATIGQVAGVAQQRDVNRQIKEARRELEEEFTPVIQEVAIQEGIDEDRAESIRLRFGNPQDPDPEITRSQQVIRYESDAQGGKGGVSQPQTNPQETGPKSEQSAGGRQEDGVITRGERPNTINNPAPDQKIAGVDEDGNPYVDYDVDGEEQIDSEYASLWDQNISAAELSTSDRGKQMLAQSVQKLLTRVRDKTLDSIGNSYQNAPQFAASNFENTANTELNRAIRSANLRKDSKVVFENTVSDIEQTYGRNDSVFNQGQNVRFYTQSFENAVRDAAEEMLRRARVVVRDGISSGESWDNVRARVEDQYGNNSVKNRANLIAHMELNRARETTKLQEFKANGDVIGVRVENPNATSRISQAVHGSEAFFENGEIDNQIAQSVNSDHLREGFDPLPRTPPYHFNDTTELKPIYKEDY